MRKSRGLKDIRNKNGKILKISTIVIENPRDLGYYILNTLPDRKRKTLRLSHSEQSTLEPLVLDLEKDLGTRRSQWEYMVP